MNFMHFDDIIGQKDIIDALKKLLYTANVAQAIIFSGDKGTGKFTLADVFAKALLCENRECKPCGVCKSCKMYATRNHPDVSIISTQKASLGIDSIRDMQKDAQIKPFFKGRKICIIKDADKLTVQAQNALLKILEQPPPYMVVIMLTQNFHSLLSTIISRCQIFKTSPVASDKIRDFLIRSLSIPLEKAAVYAHLSQGSIGDALQIAQSEEFNHLREQLIDVISKILEYDKLTSLECVEFFVQNKQIKQDIFKNFIILIRDVLIWKQTENERLIVNLDKIDIIKRYSNSFTLSQLKYIIDVIQQTKRMVDDNANYQLAVENMILDIQGVRDGGYSSRCEI